MLLDPAGSNPQPPDHQIDVHRTEPQRPVHNMEDSSIIFTVSISVPVIPIDLVKSPLETELSMFCCMLFFVTAPDKRESWIFFLFLYENISRVERKTSVSQMVVFPQT